MPRSARMLTIGLAAGLAALGVAPAIAAPATAAPATAAPTAAPTAEVQALGLTSSDRVAATSPFFAGYVGTGVGDAATSAVFTVPTYPCRGADNGMVTTVWAISADGEFLAGPDLYSYCSGGQFVLDGHVTTSGGQIPIWQELVPGDLVEMSITKRTVGPSTHDVTFRNLTRGWTSTLPTNSPVERIEIGQRRISVDGVRLQPPTFGRFTFNDVRFDDVELAAAGATRTRLVDESGETLARVSPPRGDDFALVATGR